MKTKKLGSRNAKAYINHEKKERLCLGECRKIMSFDKFRKNCFGGAASYCRECEKKKILAAAERKRKLFIEQEEKHLYRG